MKISAENDTRNYLLEFIHSHMSAKYFSDSKLITCIIILVKIVLIPTEN